MGRRFGVEWGILHLGAEYEQKRGGGVEGCGEGPGPQTQLAQADEDRGLRQ